MSADGGGELPMAVITRLMKEATDDKAGVTSEAKTAMRYAARVFILYLASCANDVASSGKRSTIQGKDVLKAIDEIDFSAWRPTLEKLLSEHNSALAKKKSEKKAGGIDENVDENDDDDDNDDDKDEMDEDDNNNVQDEKEKDGDDVEMKDADV